MNEFNIFDVLMPAVTGLAGWLAGARKRRNDFLSELQASIDLLSAENKELLQEVVILRKENANLLSNQQQMQIEIVELRRENADLKTKIEELNKRLANVRTITKTEKR